MAQSWPWDSQIAVKKKKKEKKKNSRLHSEISLMQKEVLLSHKLQDYAYAPVNPGVS